VNRILKPITYVLAAAYFLVDAVFIAVAKPVSDWLAKHFGAEEIAVLDQIALALPIARAVLSSCDCLGTG
jgi:hypothetical protein